MCRRGSGPAAPLRTTPPVPVRAGVRGVRAAALGGAAGRARERRPPGINFLETAWRADMVVVSPRTATSPSWTSSPAVAPAQRLLQAQTAGLRGAPRRGRPSLRFRAVASLRDTGARRMSAIARAATALLMTTACPQSGTGTSDGGSTGATDDGGSDAGTQPAQLAITVGPNWTLDYPTGLRPRSNPAARKPHNALRSGAALLRRQV